MIEYRARCMLLSMKLKEANCLFFVSVLGLEGKGERCRRKERVSKIFTIPQGKKKTSPTTAQQAEYSRNRPLGLCIYCSSSLESIFSLIS